MSNGNGTVTTSPIIPPWTTGQVIAATLFVVAVMIGIWLLLRFSIVIIALFVAIVVSTAISPGVDWLHRHSVPRALGVILFYVLLIGVVTSFIFLVVPLILDQVTSIATSLPGYYQGFSGFLQNSPSYLLRRLASELPSNLQIMLPSGGGTAEAELQQAALVFGYMSLAIGGLLLGLAIFLLAFYWTLDGERTIRSLLLLLPVTRRESIREVWSEIQFRLGSYTRGQALLCLSIAVLALVVYLILGIPYALSLALFAGLVEAVPILGPSLGAIPPAIVILGSGDPSKLVWLIIGTVIIQSIEGYLLVPRIMGKTLGVSPLVTLLAIAAFTSLMGIPGAFLAIPIAAVVQVLLDRFLLQPGVLDPAPSEGRDTTSVLRMELQELATDIRKNVREMDGGLGGETDKVEEQIEALALELGQILDQSAQASLPQENRTA